MAPVGEINNSTERGWAGNGTDSVEDLVEKISTLSIKDCPDIVLRRWNKYVDLSSIELTPAFHPQGQCCRATFSKEDIESNFEAIMIGYLRNVTKSRFLKKCRVFLSNPITASYFHLNDFNMDKSQDFSKGQLKIVKVTASEEHYLEDNPSFNCKSYYDINEYHQVQENSLRKINSEHS